MPSSISSSDQRYDIQNGARDTILHSVLHNVGWLVGWCCCYYVLVMGQPYPFGTKALIVMRQFESVNSSVKSQWRAHIRRQWQTKREFWYCCCCYESRTISSWVQGSNCFVSVWVRQFVSRVVVTRAHPPSVADATRVLMLLTVHK